MTFLKSRKLTIALFLFYLCVLVGLILFKTKLSFRFLYYMFNFQDPNVSRSINLVPFGGMLWLNGKPAYNEILLNVWVFVPFGAFLCMLSNKKSFLRLLLIILLTTLCLEVAQYVFYLGSSDITDVIANTLGGLLGVGVFFALRAIFKQKVYPIINTVALCFAVGFILLMTQVRFL